MNEITRMDDLIHRFDSLQIIGISEILWREYCSTFVLHDLDDWMRREFFMVMNSWLRYYYENKEYCWDYLPSWNRIFITEGEFHLITENFGRFIIYLWEQEKGRCIYPEEQHHLHTFLDEYYDYIYEKAAYMHE
jgi:hypothetical protein